MALEETTAALTGLDIEKRPAAVAPRPAPALSARARADETRAALLGDPAPFKAAAK